MTTVEQLWRYPVKSMLGTPVVSVQLVPLGIAGDRTWATRDLRRGGIRGAKQIGALMELAATYPDDDDTRAPLIRLPGGAMVVAGAPGTDERVSDAIGHPVRLEPLAPTDDLEHYRRGPSDHADQLEGMRAVFALEADEPLPDFSAFPPDIVEFESPPGTYYDAWPLLVLTTSSLRELQRLAPASVIDVRRFRPSILLADDGDGFVEQGWSGRQARLGGAVIEFGAPCPRCIMVTRAFAGLPEDRSIMRTLVRENRQSLGVYGTIVEPGEVKVGDRLEWIS